MLLPTEKIFEKEERKAFLSHLFRKIFLDDWIMKLLALIITFALWLGISGLRAPKTERMRNIALNLRVSNEVEITNSPITEIDIVVTGDDRKIEQLNPRDLVASLDLTEAQAGEQTVQITPENINIELPSGIKLEEVQPNKLAVKLEKVAETELTVKPETIGNLPEGYEIYSETVTPQKVRVRAPESYIKSLDFISTERISIEAKQDDFIARQVALNVVNPKVTLLDTVVDVTFRIGEKRTERLFLVPVKTDDGDKWAKIVLFGGRTILNNLNPEDIEVSVSKNETGETIVAVSLPPEIQNKTEIRDKRLISK
jgi:YbbR domain-containing protein